MKLYYVTLNNSEEASQISRALLERRLAVCVNWFPITCAYRWEGKITEEPEVVMMVKTQIGYRVAIEQVIRQHITYTNFIAEITPTNVNQGFLDWLNAEVSSLAPLYSLEA
jgi:periplasmic divalent cation tolerance protein